MKTSEQTRSILSTLCATVFLLIIWIFYSGCYATNSPEYHAKQKEIADQAFVQTSAAVPGLMGLPVGVGDLVGTVTQKSIGGQGGGGGGGGHRD